MSGDFKTSAMWMWVCLILIALGRVQPIALNVMEETSSTPEPCTGSEGTSPPSTEELGTSATTTEQLGDNANTTDTVQSDDVTRGGDVTPSDDTVDDDLSFMAEILIENNYMLGAGAVVGDRWIICTAFQMGAFKAQQLRVRVGGQLLMVDRLIVHPLFSGFSMDAALLRTTEPVTVRPIQVARRLPDTGESTRLLVWVGTGKIQEIQADILHIDECQMFYPAFELTDTNICSVTDYDLPYHMRLFGSPLVSTGKGNGDLVGHYMGLEESNKPALFTSLTPLNGWIQLVMTNETEAKLSFPLSEEIID